MEKLLNVTGLSDRTHHCHIYSFVRLANSAAERPFESCNTLLNASPQAHIRLLTSYFTSTNKVKNALENFLMSPIFKVNFIERLHGILKFIAQGLTYFVQHQTIHRLLVL